MGVVAVADFFGLVGAEFAYEHAEGGFDFFGDAVVFVLHVRDEDEEEIVDIAEDVFGALDVDGKGGDVSGFDVAHEFFVGSEEFANLVIGEYDAPVLFTKNDIGLEAHFIFARADAKKNCVVNNRPHTPGGLLRQFEYRSCVDKLFGTSG